MRVDELISEPFIRLPDWHDVNRKLTAMRGEVKDLTALERFIHEHEPFSVRRAVAWREALRAALEEISSMRASDGR